MEISLHIIDIAENAAAAGASLIEIEIEETCSTYDVTVADDGAGMTEDELSLAVRAGYTTKPHGSGLGLPKLIEAVAQAGGRFSIDSQTDGDRGRATVVRASFPKGDGAPGLGDVAGAVATVVSDESGCDVVFTHDIRCGDGVGARVGIDTRTLRRAAGNVRHFTPEMLRFVRDELRCQYESAQKTALLS